MDLGGRRIAVTSGSNRAATGMTGMERRRGERIRSGRIMRSNRTDTRTAAAQHRSGPMVSLARTPTGTAVAQFLIAQFLIAPLMIVRCLIAPFLTVQVLI
jgi:hypothetical protein